MIHYDTLILAKRAFPQVDFSKTTYYETGSWIKEFHVIQLGSRRNIKITMQRYLLSSTEYYQAGYDADHDICVISEIAPLPERKAQDAP